MNWSNADEWTSASFYSAVEAYYKANKNLNIPVDYITRTQKGAGQKLGAGISPQ